jgi:predicted  nucleic acid-binding Zn-ribbon protein
MNHLPERVADLTSRAQQKTDELLSVMDHAKESRRDITAVAVEARRDLQSSFEELRVTLEEEEAALLAEVDRCTSDVSEILFFGDTEAEAHARNASTSCICIIGKQQTWFRR